LIIKLIKSIISTLQFCTSLPLPFKTDQSDLQRGITFFPLAGTIIGLICGVILNYSAMIWNPTAAAVLTITVYLIITRALHMDGFMDTIDGFFSGKPRDKILLIMKEPAAGAFAVCGSLCWFGWQIAFLPLIRWQQLILIFTISRLGSIWLGLISSYPRESGTGKFFVENIKSSHLVFGLILSLGLAFWQGLLNLVLIPFIIVYAWLISTWAKNKISGITGDVLGFYIESSSLLSLLILSLLNKLG
jgi:adenosylcobinamide-GDP ribazoletransferase